MFFMLIIYVSNFVSIRYFLLYDLINLYFMHNFNYKNLQFKQFIDEVAINH